MSSFFYNLKDLQQQATTTCMKINREWNWANRMPANAKLQQRIDCHIEHAKYCQCRTRLPAKLKTEMKIKELNRENNKFKF